MNVVVRPYAEFRATLGEEEITVSISSDASVRDVLRSLIARSPQLANQIFEAEGSLSGHVNIFVNGVSVRGKWGLDTRLQDGDKIFLVSAFGGG